jgi:hypothetical protein
VFGTFLTLIMVPVMYLLLAKLKERIFKKSEVTLTESSGDTIPAI